MTSGKKINDFLTAGNKINDQWEKNLCQAVKKSTYNYKAIIVLGIDFCPTGHRFFSCWP